MQTSGATHILTINQGDAMTIQTFKEILDDMTEDDSNIKYEITKNSLDLKVNGWTYSIEKGRCLTREDRWDWLAHMCEKNWIDNYTFMITFLKACKTWGI